MSEAGYSDTWLEEDDFRIMFCTQPLLR
jgi:hypothetical protein